MVPLEDSDGDSDFDFEPFVPTVDLISVRAVCGLAAATMTFNAVGVCGAQGLTASALQAPIVKMTGIKALTVYVAPSRRACSARCAAA